MKRIILISAVVVLAGCSESRSSSPSGPSVDDIARAGHTVVVTDHGRACIPDGTPIPPGSVVIPGPPSNPPADPPGPPTPPTDSPLPPVSPVDPPVPPVTPPKPPKACDDPHFGGGNNGLDCGKDDPNKHGGINDGPTKGKP